MNIKAICKKGLHIITFLVIFVGVLAVFSLVGIPGSRLYVVESESMDPTIPKGSIILTSRAGSYTKNDVITFVGKIDKETDASYTITHRLVDIVQENGQMLYQTKGDANVLADRILVDPDEVIGKVNFSLPYLGYVVGLAKTKIGFLIFVIFPALYILIKELGTIVSELKHFTKF